MTINTNLVCELQSAVKVQYLDGNLFSQDVQGNVINVTVLDGGEPATLSGSVSANIIRADGGTVAATGGTFAGNVASITLPAAAYSVPGVVSIVVKVTDSGVTTTIAAVVANIYQSSTDTVVDPGTILPSVQTLIAAIDAAVASIPADYSSLWSSLAPNYSNLAFPVYTGYLCTYDGHLYRAKGDIPTSETWNSAHWDQTDFGSNITDLRSIVNRNVTVAGANILDISDFDTTTDANVTYSVSGNKITVTNGSTNTYACIQTSDEMLAKLVPGRMYRFHARCSVTSGNAIVLLTAKAGNTFVNPLYIGINREGVLDFEMSSSITSIAMLVAWGSSTQGSVVEFSELWVKEMGKDTVARNDIIDLKSALRSTISIDGGSAVMPVYGTSIIQGGAASDGSVSSRSDRIRLSGFFQVSKGTAIQFTAGTFTGQIDIVKYVGGVTIRDYGWKSSLEDFIIDADCEITIAFRKNSNNDNITPSDYDATTIINPAWEIAEKATDNRVSVLEGRYSTGKNIADPANKLASSVLSTNGSASSSSSFDTFYDIPVRSGVTYSIIGGSRIYVVYPDKGAPTSSSRTHSDASSDYPTSVTPSADGYLAISIDKDTLPCVCISGDLTEYEAYYIRSTTKVNLNDVVGIDDVQEELENDTKILTKMGRMSANLIDPDDIEDSTAITVNTSGKYTTSSSNSYDSVLSIPLKAGKTYKIMPVRLYQVMKMDDTTYVASSTTNRTEEWTYTPTVDCLMSICYYKNPASIYIVDSSIADGYEPYGELILEPTLAKYANPLQGKTIYNFGDSVSNGEGTANKRGPAELVADQFLMKCTDYSVSGASITKDTGTPSRSCVQTQIENASANEPDFVLIAGGINDLKFTTAGTAPSAPTSYEDFGATYIAGLDLTKFSGSFEKVLYTAINKYPHAQILYMFENKMYGHFNDGTPSLREVAIAICKKWDVSVVDFWEDGGLNLAIIPYLTRYGAILESGGVEIDGVHYDGTHPNEEGYRMFFVPKLSRALMERCPVYDAST